MPQKQDFVQNEINRRLKTIQVKELPIQKTYGIAFAELDSLAKDIHLAITLQLWIPALTATNFFLEHALKTLLIIEPQKGRFSGPEHHYLWTAPTPKAKDIMNYDLDKSINQSCKTGIITKKQKGELHRYRACYRNGYGHANIMQVTPTYQMGPGTSGSIEVMVAADAAPPGVNSVSFVLYAAAHCQDYFLAVDALIRHCIARHFPPTGPEVATI